MVPDHDVPGSPSPANSEMQIQFPHRIAITTAYGSGVGAPLQWGANNAPMWEFNQNQLNITPANTLGFSGPKMWQAYVSDGAGAGARSYEVYPGLISGGYTFNGLGGNVGGWEFDVFSDSLDTSSLGLLGTWRGTTAARANLVHGLQVYDTTNHLYKGTAIKGAVRLEKTAASATGLTGIDFGSASCRDLSASGNSVTFFTTNVVSGSTNFQKLSCILRANGFAPTLAYPAWCTNAPLPSSLTANQMLLLNLQAVGTGETNILVESSSVLLDQTFGYDQAVTDFMFRSGLSSLSISNALNTFVKRLKVDSTWSQLDALYPFAGTTAAQNKWNLANTNLYTITFSGTITHGNGILGNGSTGFGDTGWTPSQNDTLVFAWCSNFTASTFLYVLGSQNVSGNGSAIRDGGSVAGLQTGANISIGNLNTTDVATPAMPNGFAASRSGSGSFNVYFGYSGLSSPSIASASPSGATVYVLARNNNGSADQFWDKTVQVVALGRNISQSQYQTLYSATTNLNAALGR